jgi:hypothetical protein
VLIGFGDSEEALQEFPMKCGAVGQAVTKAQGLNIVDLYNDPYYNSLVDLTTTFPVSIIPIHHIEETTIIGALEFANVKGITMRSKQNKAYLDTEDA